MRFSVIIPIYNKAPYVKKALDSVLSQSFRDFEIIVVDDGSSDNSYDVAKERLNDTHVEYKLIQQNNAGVSIARNNGVAASKGDYLCFLDADDWWSPTFLERIDLFVREYPEAGIYGTNYYYVKNGRSQVCVTTAETGYINYCRVYAEKLQMPLCIGSVCVPRRVFDVMGGFRPHLKLGEDFDLWIKIALAFNVAFLNEPLFYYFQDSDATWRSVGRLHDPKVHMLWNLQYLEGVENRNPDYKALIDNLRTYCLFPYYLSDQYRTAARQELEKVDWSKQSRKTQLLYKAPVPLLKCRQIFLKVGSIIKQAIMKQR